MSAAQAALITGGATRVGRYFATLLAERGYDIALHYNSSAEQAGAVAEEIRTLGRDCATFACDFRGDDVEALAGRVHERFPGLSLLVNSASVYTPAPIRDTGRALLEEQFAVNLFAPFLLSKGYANSVGRGLIVNILDNKITYQQYPYAAYLLSKKTFAEFTRMAAVEFAPRIRVNGIAPGVILPAQSRSSDYIEWRKEGIPLRRQGAVEDLGRALGYLIDSEFVTGQILAVDGGESVNLVGRHSENYPGA